MTEPTGFTAVGMVGFTDKGTYSASASYVKNDLVHYGGSIWCCLIDDTTGIEPRNDSANWEVFIDYSDLSNIKSDFLSLGYINQIPYPYYDGTSKTADGITWTVNNDKSITINGTATKITYFYLLFHNANALTPNTPYAMSLGSDTDSSKLRMQITYRADGGTEQVRQSSSKTETEFTINDSNITTIQFRLVVLNGQAIDNLTVYPYIRKLTDGKSNRQLTEEVTQNSSDIQTLTNNVNSAVLTLTNKDTAIESEISDVVNVLGSKNLLPNNVTTQVINGVTFTVNSDGSISTSGTATSDAFISMPVSLKKGTYTVTSTPPGGSTDTFLSGKSDLGIDTGNGTTWTLENDITTTFYITIKNGFNSNGLVFKPMIRPASIEDGTYVPYAMTNVELTNSVIKQRIDVTIADGTNHTATIEPLADGYNPFQCLSYQNQFVVGQRLLYGNKLQVKFETGAEGTIIPCFVYYRKRG